VGRTKLQSARDTLLEINPNVKIQCRWPPSAADTWKFFFLNGVSAPYIGWGV
jgi:hypothetical protein